MCINQKLGQSFDNSYLLTDQQRSNQYNSNSQRTSQCLIYPPVVNSFGQYTMYSLGFLTDEFIVVSVVN